MLCKGIIYANWVVVLRVYSIFRVQLGRSELLSFLGELFYICCSKIGFSQF